MMKSSTTIPIFFTIDNNYAPLLGVALKSLIANASKDRQYIIHIIHEGLSEENRSKLEALALQGFEIKISEFELLGTGISDRSENHLRCDYFTLTIFYRLFLAELFPEYDKAIYLDSDIIVPGDISELYDIKLYDSLLGACPDLSVGDVPELVNWIEKGVGVPSDRYINSGILLMNFKRLREVKFSEHFLNLLNTWHFESIAPDQDYINAICAGQILFLPAEWDVMPNQRKPLFPEPKLIHYNLFEKPWLYDGVQYSDYFWKYAFKSVFFKQICAIKDGYSQAQKTRDRICMENMIKKAVEAPQTGMVFSKVAESKVRIARSVDMD